MISRDEAMLVFAKLQSEGTKVLCIGELRVGNFCFTGTIQALTEEKISLIALDRRAQFSLNLDSEEIYFCYSEPKDAISSRAVPKIMKDAAGITVASPIPTASETESSRTVSCDYVSLFEIRDKPRHT